MKEKQIKTCSECGQVIKQSKIKPNDAAKIIAQRLFDFWKFISNKPKSSSNNQHINTICAKLREGYDEDEIAHAVIGLSHSSYHQDNGYNHIYYVTRVTAIPSQFISKANNAGITRGISDQMFEDFCNDYDTMPLDIQIKLAHEKEKQQLNKETGVPLK